MQMNKSDGAVKKFMIKESDKEKTFLSNLSKTGNRKSICIFMVYIYIFSIYIYIDLKQ